MTIEIIAFIRDDKEKHITICECESIDMLVKNAKENGDKFSQVQFFVIPTDVQMEEVKSVTDIVEYPWGGTNIYLPVEDNIGSGSFLYRQRIHLE